MNQTSIFKMFSKSDWILYITGCIIFLVGGISIILLLSSGDVTDASIEGFLGSFAPAVVGPVLCIIVQNSAQTRFEKRRREEREAVKKQQQEEASRQRNELISSGKWKFPVEGFYKKCVECDIESIDTPLILKKAMLIAEEYLDTDIKNSEFKELYYSEEKVKKYFEQGKKKRIATLKKPLRAELNESQKQVCDIAKTVVKCEGIEKRKKWLQLEINYIKKQIQEHENAIKRAENSCSSKAASLNAKKRDWAVHGGIAEAIAGPAAAIATVADVHKKNADLDRSINDIKQLFVELAAPALSAKAKLEKVQEQYTEELERTKYAVAITNIDTNVLFSSLTIKKHVYNIGKKPIEITLDFSSNYLPKNSDEMRMVIDGVVNIKVFASSDEIDDNSEVLVGETLMPCPMLGVKYGGEKSESVTYLPKHMNKDVLWDYRVEVKPHKLWLVEK